MVAYLLEWEVLVLRRIQGGDPNLPNPKPNPKLTITKEVCIIIFFLYQQKTRWNSDIQDVYSEIIDFRKENRDLEDVSVAEAIVWC